MIDKKAKLEGKARKLIKREQDLVSTPEQFTARLVAGFDG